jgi:hypothetical protein
LGSLDLTWDGSHDLQAAESAVEADPENVEARLHLASLLVVERPADALEHLTVALSRDPTSLEALGLAACAAAAIGDSQRAGGYRRLVAALGGTVEPAATAPPAEAPRVGADPSPQVGQPAPATRPALSLPGKDGLGRARLHVLNPDEPDDQEWRGERPTITLNQVAGMEAVKRRLNVAFLGPLRNPELRQMYGKSLRGGLLLYGPPGCGKTFIARATAGELGAKFVSIGVSDVLDMWLGESERHLHEIFETARRNAPTVLFFDEIDAIGQKRSQLRNSASLSSAPPTIPGMSIPPCSGRAASTASCWCYRPMKKHARRF